MADLTPGAPVKSTGLATIDNMLPVTDTISKTLVPGADQLIQGDPTAGDIVFTLPNSVANPGVEFFVKRIVNGSNVVRLNAGIGESIQSNLAGTVLGLEQEYIHVYSDGTTIWKKKNQRTFSFGALEVAGGSFAATTTPAKFTGWDAIKFQTPQKIVPSLVNQNMDLPNFQGPTSDGYKVDLVISCEFTNNQIVTAQIFADGVLQGVSVNVNGLGAGKPVTLSINQPIIILNPTTAEVQLSVETNGTITQINGSFVLERIGG